MKHLTEHVKHLTAQGKHLTAQVKQGVTAGCPFVLSGVAIRPSGAPSEGLDSCCVSDGPQEPNGRILTKLQDTVQGIAISLSGVPPGDFGSCCLSDGPKEPNDISLTKLQDTVQGLPSARQVSLLDTLAAAASQMVLRNQTTES